MLWTVALANLRQHRASLAGVFATLLVASALVTGLGVLIQSGVSGGMGPQRYVGVDIVVGGSQSLDVPEDIDPVYAERAPLPAGAADTLRNLPDVEQVVLDTTVPLTSTEGPVDAHSWDAAAMTPFVLTEGTTPTAEHDVVVTDGTAALGDRLDLEYGGIGEAYTVVGLATSVTDGVEHVFLSNAAMSALNPGARPVLGIIARDGANLDQLVDAVRTAVPEATTYMGRDRGDVEFPASGAARSELAVIATSFAGTAVMVAIFVVASTLSMSITQRKRNFALLRAVGATPRQIHRMIGAEILTVGAIAAVLGIVPGYLLAGVLGSLFRSVGTIPEGFELSYGPLPALIAVGSVLVTGRVAAWSAARRPARMSPVDAVREAAVTPPRIGRTRALLGILCVVAGLVTATLPTFVSGEAGIAGAASSALVLVIALGLLGPLIVRAIMTAVGAIMRRSSSPAVFLALTNARANAHRSASAIVPLALAIAIGATQLFTQSTTEAEAARQARAAVTADLVVTSGGAGLSPAAVQQIESQPGVGSVDPIVRSQLYVTYPQVDVPVTAPLALQGVEPSAVPDAMDPGFVQGDPSRLDDEKTIALSTDAAAGVGAKVGEAIDARMGDGTAVSLSVVALYERGLGLGDATMNTDSVLEHSTYGLYESALVTAESGRIGDATAALTELGLTVSEPDSLSAAGDGERSSQSWTNLIALAVLLGYIAVAVVNTLVIATTERARELALLRLVGAARSQVRSMMRVESWLVGLSASLIGTMIALPPLMGVAFGISGRPVPDVSVFAYLAMVGATVALGLLSVAVPTASIQRSDPLSHVGTRA